MKAFTINHLWIDTKSPMCRAEFTFAITDGQPIMFDRVFANRNEADLHLYSSMLTWLRDVVDKYIHHKKHIIDAGTPTPQVKEALQMCLEFQTKMYEKQLSIKSICQGILRGKQYFEAILPSPNNPSYQNSVNNLNELLTFCNENNK